DGLPCSAAQRRARAPAHGRGWHDVAVVRTREPASDGAARRARAEGIRVVLLSQLHLRPRLHEREAHTRFGRGDDTGASAARTVLESHRRRRCGNAPGGAPRALRRHRPARHDGNTRHRLDAAHSRALRSRRVAESGAAEKLGPHAHDAHPQAHVSDVPPVGRRPQRRGQAPRWRRQSRQHQGRVKGEGTNSIFAFVFAVRAATSPRAEMKSRSRALFPLPSNDMLRKIFSGALLFAAGYFVATFQPPCTSPLTYRIGQVDSRFGLSVEDVESALGEAERIWETPAYPALFEYDPDGEVVVNFLYDNRQRIAQENSFRRRRIERTGSRTDRLKARFDAATARFENAKRSHLRKQAEYDALLTQHNRTVDAWNARGGAPGAAYQEIQ